MQSAGTVTLDCILLELLPFEHCKIATLPHTRVHSRRAQEPLLWIAYFWSYCPLRLPFLPQTRVRSVTSKPFEIFS